MSERDTHIRRPRLLNEIGPDLAWEIERHMKMTGMDAEAVAVRARLKKRYRYRFEAWLRGEPCRDFNVLAAMAIAEQIGVPIAFLCGEEARRAA